MSTVAGVSSQVSASVAASVSQQTIASLQAQMLRYAQPANGQNSQASADYKALQTAVQSGNVSDAQAALARLKRDSQAGNPASNAGSTPPATTSTVDGDGDQPWNAINVTA